MDDVKLPSAINLATQRKKLEKFVCIALLLTFLSFVVDSLPEIMSLFGVTASDAFEVSTSVFGFVALVMSMPFYFHYVVLNSMGTDLKAINDQQLENAASHIKDHPELLSFVRDIKAQERTPVRSEYHEILSYVEEKERNKKQQDAAGITLWNSLK